MKLPTITTHRVFKHQGKVKLNIIQQTSINDHLNTKILWKKDEKKASRNSVQQVFFFGVLLVGAAYGRRR